MGKRWKVCEPCDEYRALERRLVMTARTRPPSAKEVVGCSVDVAELFAHLADEPDETFHVACLDNRNRVIATVKVCDGATNQAAIEPRAVFRAPIICNAVSIALVHNHPSGNPEPSPEDIILTKTIIEAANMLGFRVLDHVIIGCARYVSLADRGEI